jgi:cytidylate kinase
MAKIYDIRGTHGSGKSTIAKQLIDEHGGLEIVGNPLTYAGNPTILGYHIPKFNLVVLGRYKTQCGGCDGIKTQSEIKARISHYEEQGRNVLLEGILVAHTYGPWNEFASGRDWRFRFLDTPLDVCIDRVNARRAEKGKPPLEDPKNIVRDHKRILSLHGKFVLQHDSRLLPYESAYQLMVSELNFDKVRL